MKHVNVLKRIEEEECACVWFVHAHICVCSLTAGFAHIISNQMCVYMWGLGPLLYLCTLFHVRFWWMNKSLRFNDCLPPMKNTEVFCIVPDSLTHRMESTVPKANWQEMSRRDMSLQRPSHRQRFVGRFPLQWQLSVRACCLHSWNTWRRKSSPSVNPNVDTSVARPTMLPWWGKSNK